jgi:pyridoxal 5'-phosphate synthase pdxS subunit
VWILPARKIAAGEPVPKEQQTVSESQQPTTGPVTGTARVKRGMAEMLKGGVIMDVVTP